MFVRLRDNWVYGGFLAAIMLLALTPVLTSGWSLPLLLIWLQLPVYMLHQFEEHDDDRFRKFINATIGGGKELLSRFDVFVINIVGVWGVDTVAIWLAARLHLGLGLIAVYLSLVNALAHCGQAVAMRRYNPGLITAILLFIPLGVATLWVLARTGAVTTTDHVIGLGAAILIHAAIIVRVVTQRRKLARPAVVTA
ncbi:HXXEE domain-containing protein [uncultured Amaricoccus sp.]|uniref:HXXEE domain-containing protein n=1 Tax=uncultured Amaricoccus sp. TaxID=339341 RepID=UPI00260EB79D|nr:HXXEE domain-containing protein [uncultured Amaricoccus sp.]